MPTRGRRAWFALIAIPLLLVGAACAQAPAAPATPAPPTAVPPPASGTSKLFLTVDVVQGSKNIPPEQLAAKACVNTGRFPRNAEIVWRARVLDPQTGDLMDSRAISSIGVKLANGAAIEMKYGPHPVTPPNEFFWTGSWLVPKTQAPGTLDWSVVATSVDGRRGEYKPLNVAPSRLTILDEVLADLGTPVPAAVPAKP